MIPVFQSEVGRVKGDCFEAAVASMLGVALAAVPTSGQIGSGDEWIAYQDRLDEWLRWEHGLTLWGVPFVGDRPRVATWENAPRTLWLAAIATPVESMAHALVCRGNRVVHDPYPPELRADPPPSYLADPAVEAIYLLLPRR